MLKDQVKQIEETFKDIITDYRTALSTENIADLLDATKRTADFMELLEKVNKELEEKINDTVP